jgi:hypothetical protein
MALPSGLGNVKSRRSICEVRESDGRKAIEATVFFKIGRSHNKPPNRTDGRDLNAKTEFGFHCEGVLRDVMARLK